MPPSIRPALPHDARLLLWGVVVDAFGSGLTVPLLLVYLHQVRGIPLETVELIVAEPAIVALLLLAPIGVMIDVFGPRRVQMVALAAAASGALLLSQAATVPLAFLARALTGVGYAAFFPASQSLVASVVPGDQRQWYFGVSFALLNAGIGVGGLVTAWVVDVARPGTFAAVYLADALTFLVPLALLAWPLRHLGGPGEGSGGPAAGSYGEVFAAIIVGLQLVVLRLIDGWRRTRVLAALAAAWALAWTIMGIAALEPGSTRASVLLVVAFGVFACGETLLSPTLPSIINDVAPERLRARYNAAAFMAFQLAAIAAPAIDGVLLGRGHAVPFVGMLVAGCGVLAAAALRLGRSLPAHANGVRG